jgi:D-beta-D-heptose 7-phosphate kinase/D-beta-D-heptose 1-phosphate adenosyltransferase
MDVNLARQLLSRVPSLKILVLGDFMLDHFVWGNVERISPEAPVPIVNVAKETFSLGGAGNVVNNLRSMGAQVIPLGVIGNDSAGEKIRDLLTENKISRETLLRSSRPTTVKTRILAHQQQVVRVDREDRSWIDEKTASKIEKKFAEILPQADAVLVSDYSKGTLSPSVLSSVLSAAKSQRKMVCLDPKVRNFSSYTPVTVITPNQTEASSLLGYPILTKEDLGEAGRRILKLIDCEALLITRGEKGMALFMDGGVTLVPARAREVYDVTGAGDTVISLLTLGLAAGAKMIDAVTLANAAAGVVVSKVGTASVIPEELLNAL